MTWRARHVSQPIERDTAAVAAFAGDPRNLPLWAAGLSAGIRLEGQRWLTDSPMGVVEVAFVGPVEHGVLDHDVVMPDGTRVHNPLRVLRNGDGSEVVFTLFQRPGMSEADFEHDAEMVRTDLARLRELLER
ncbi:SRPBCC family protein [Microbacterium sp. STN6]|uniref:SRPBCC family protein n=1 Tax=Microbacterium sp. STN6 TaxID=2995588 RepID=UPI0022608718|nr:SRPBCC family protein [Microbacterium sp. STN6]MCX7522247.1 SRPBCC family protein [Microbacterium sp. STN6]